MSNIRVKHVQQSQQYWCWAACCEMFVDHYGNTSLDQVAFAHEHNKKFQYGAVAMASMVEVAWLLKNIAGHMVDKIYRPLGFEELAPILNNNRLIMASAANHQWLIVGAEEDPSRGQIIWVHDPGRDGGPNRALYSTFKGHWKETLCLSQADIGALD